MLVNSIKIGIAVGAFVFAAITVTDPSKPQDEVLVRLPERIDQSSPPCLQLYTYIKAYADTFDIPLRYAFGIAHAETGYKGPFHWRYNPAQTSCVGAVGPMQVMLATARWINKDGVSRDKLKTDIKYNVYTSMKLLRKLFNKRGSWLVVFGEYNTGRPCINKYARSVFNFNSDKSFF
jgi:soluble lytic murein transglycosylase-like protein